MMLYGFLLGQLKLTEGRARQNATKQMLHIEGCSRSQIATTSSSLLPETPCARVDLKRHDPCAAMAEAVALAKNATSHAKLHPNRYQALLNEISLGSRIVEVGTQQGVSTSKGQCGHGLTFSCFASGMFARFMLEALKPVELRTIEKDPKWFRHCVTVTVPFGQKVGSNVTCVLGDSRLQINNLKDDAYDVIYIDA